MINKGQKINDRYEVIKLIGEGGMANVYLAHDLILDRYVAVKVLRGDLADDEKFVRRFQREAISASSLSHPNIVEMYDVGEDTGNYYIVMEYIQGITLKSLIKRRGALNLTEVIDIMKQLTSAIAHAHASYIIHRDIKPQNVLILEDGSVKITDFGIALALNSTELTQTNSVMGSVHYLPPEQASGNTATVKSDIYSLGILMYELIVGQIPFKGENAVEIAIKQMKEQIPSIRKNNIDIPQSIENIILKACAKNPKNRYQSVNDMYADLENYNSSEFIDQSRVVYAHPESELEKTKKFEPIKEEQLEVEVKEEDKKDKMLNRIIIILGSIGVLLTFGILLAIFIFPKMSEVPGKKIPEVKAMTQFDAEKKLLDEGFVVEIKEIYSNEFKEGEVAYTDPRENSVAKEGVVITLYVSLGESGLELEDYTDKNFYEIKAFLELREIYVLEDKADVEDKTLNEYTILSQSPKAGTKVSRGDTVVLTTPNIINEYPDFTDGTWKLEDVENFAEEYGINLNIVTEETDEYRPGEIIYQSRPKESKIVSGVTLRIDVAAEIPQEEEEVVDEVDGENN